MAIRVMAVDQSIAIREVLRAVIARADDLDLVAEAANGRAAVQEATALRPDVVLMDVDLPEQSGFEAAAQITDRLPNTRVVFLSNAPISQSLARRIGASAVVPKRMLAEEMLTTIRRVTGRLPSLQPVGAPPARAQGRAHPAPPSVAAAAVEEASLAGAAAGSTPLVAGPDRLARDDQLAARLADMVAATTSLAGLLTDRLAAPSRSETTDRGQAQHAVQSAQRLLEEAIHTQRDLAAAVQALTTTLLEGRQRAAARDP